MFAYFKSPVGWFELLKRTGKEIVDDNCLGLAAQLAFYFFLALFPALLFLVSLIGLLPVESAMNGLFRNLEAIAPPAVLDLLRREFDNLSSGSASGKILTFGFLGALWSSSAAMVAIIDTLNRAYDIQDSRPWWKRRLIAIQLTLALAIFIILSFSILLSGPYLTRWLQSVVGFGAPLAVIWQLLYWPLVVLLVVTAIDIVYSFAPDADTEWVWITPGSLVATTLWVLTSVGFRFYVSNFGSYNATYGVIGAVIVLLTWLYISGLSILVGAEINAEIDKAMPGRGEVVHRTTGGRRKIGPAIGRRLAELRGR
jgi:membrane protein